MGFTMIKKINIIHLQSGTGDSGGIANYISLLTSSKLLSNIKQMVVVNSRNLVFKNLYPHSEIIQFDCSYGLFSVFIKLFEGLKVFNKHKNTTINSHALRAGLLAALIRLIAARKFIHTNHGLRFTQKKGLKKIPFFIIEMFVLFFSDYYVCIRETDYKYLMRNLFVRFFRNKIKIIKLRIDFNYQNYEKLKIYKFRKPYQLYGIGSLLNHKNPIKFINWLSFLKNNDIKFDAFWIGDGPLMEEVVSLTNKQKLNIKWLGHLSKEKVYSLLSKATYLIQTSDYEVYPTVVIESFSTGTPVISSYYFGVNELINNFENGLIIENSIHNKPKKLVEMFKNKKSYFSLSEKCLNDYKLYHQDNSITTRAYLDLYEAVSS